MGGAIALGVIVVLLVIGFIALMIYGNIQETKPGTWWYEKATQAQERRRMGPPSISYDYVGRPVYAPGFAGGDRTSSGTTAKTTASTRSTRALRSARGA